MYEKNHFLLISDNRVAKNNTIFKLEGVFQQVSLTSRDESQTNPGLVLPFIKNGVIEILNT